MMEAVNLRYIVSTLINVTMYPQYNNVTIKIKLRKKTGHLGRARTMLYLSLIPQGLIPRGNSYLVVPDSVHPNFHSRAP
jgi:hypothetical protein